MTNKEYERIIKEQRSEIDRLSLQNKDYREVIKDTSQRALAVALSEVERLRAEIERLTKELSEREEDESNGI